MVQFCCVCCIETDGRMRNGVRACAACKAFFLIHYNSGSYISLKCKGGHNGCMVAVSQDSIVGSDGSVYRHLCSKCRYEKCITIGMRKKRDKVLQKSNTTETQLVPAPVNNQMVQLEKELSELYLGAAKFNNALVNMEGSRHFCHNHNQLADMAIANFRIGSVALTEFLKCIPSYVDISLANRVTLFSHGLAGITMLSGAVADDPLPFSGLNMANMKEFVRVYPTFKIFIDECLQMRFNIKNQNLTNFEFYWLLALSYFTAPGFDIAKQTNAVTVITKLTQLFHLYNLGKGGAGYTLNDSKLRLKKMMEIIWHMQHILNKRTQFWAETTDAFALRSFNDRMIAEWRHHLLEVAKSKVKPDGNSQIEAQQNDTDGIGNAQEMEEMK